MLFTVPRVNYKVLGYFLLTAFVFGAQIFMPASPLASTPSVNKHIPKKTSSIVHLVAGTYNQKGSEGIYFFNFDAESNKFSSPTLVAKADNPSFIHIESDKLYVVNELGDGQLSTYKVQGDRTLSKLSSTATNGASPCYISASKDSKYLVTANYMGGNISVFNVDQSGVPQAKPQILQHFGKGANKSRQEAAHAHWAQWSPSSSYLYAVDLGIDEVKVYPFNQDTGQAGKGKTALQLNPGDGPRHMVFHPRQPMVYILNELSNSITVATRAKDGFLTSVQRIDTLPPSFTEHSQAGHIAITQNGRTLYVSNRGHDSIAAYRVDREGRLTLLATESTRGHWPRHFIVLEALSLIIVANQEGNNVVALKINTDGTLTAADAELKLPQVTFLGQLSLPRR